MPFFVKALNPFGVTSHEAIDVGKITELFNQIKVIMTSEMQQGGVNLGTFDLDIKQDEAAQK